LRKLLPDAHLGQFNQACRFGLPLYQDKNRLPDIPLDELALNTALILVQMQMDSDTCIAAFLQWAGEFIDEDTLSRHCSKTVLQLIQGVTRMRPIEQFQAIEASRQRESRHQAEAFRQMLLAMAEDIRVVIIKLAERVVLLRLINQANPETIRSLANETMDIHAPLANRLGIWQIKWELEDRAFRLLEPDRYLAIARLLEQNHEERTLAINAILDTLKEKLDEAHIQASLSGRPKHIMSIIRKMTRKHKSFEQIYDVRAVRVQVKNIAECYAVLGLIHALWPPIPGEFDDYIAHPKSNNYRALHTAVIGPENRAVEIQICTEEMYQEAEYGVAAHWRYKEGMQATPGDEQIAWVRQILRWKDDLNESDLSFSEHFKHALFQDKVYVLSPLGKVIDLPRGATPIDFAYALHSTLGHHCKGALVDGSIVPLNTALSTGQRVEILTSKYPSPSRDWLNPALGYITTAKAKMRVRQWFRQQEFSVDASNGRNILEKELNRLNATWAHDKIAQSLGFAHSEDLYAAIARNEITTTQIQNLVNPADPITPDLILRPKSPNQDSNILLEGQANLLTQIAGCCKPLPPDAIGGFITIGRGASIHRISCPTFIRLQAKAPERVFQASWGKSQSKLYASDIEIRAANRDDLTTHINDLLRRQKIKVTAMRAESRHGLSKLQYTIETPGMENLNQLLEDLE
ncbi:MAG: bifunctional (p)ppGpp synthetase/guanosine-3',5'-bis(diphosphate) 3'-pyrophosphohydrolase, partial [Pseudomonadota bacterium]|nr:bifunctional (p)ppGpp synthetase/guanosine-3',5'-bis(diphosphate) 3'-pyrophosphohydrolase [Pseudomonadota bacterium]